MGDTMMRRRCHSSPRHRMAASVLLLTGGTLISAAALAHDPSADPAKTEVWTPVPAVGATPVGAAPSDAVVLFGGSSLGAWESEQGGEAPWKVADGAVTVVPGSKGIRTRQRFCDIQLHIEWRSPTQTRGADGQNRGNSGGVLQEPYDL